MVVPLILRSDKTLASNATGQNEFHPLYISPGNVRNSVRRAHCDALIPIGFLAIPKSKEFVAHFFVVSCTLLGSRKDGRSTLFRSFRRQLMHESIKTILSPLRPYMSKPDVVMCPDGFYRRAVYALGPYIADYPEQVILAGVVSGWCVWCVSLSFPPLTPLLTRQCTSCTSPPNYLDRPNPILRSKEHTHACKSAFDSKTMWENYGIVDNVIVSHQPVCPVFSHHCSSSRSPNIFPVQISTN